MLKRDEAKKGKGFSPPGNTRSPVISSPPPLGCSEAPQEEPEISTSHDLKAKPIPTIAFDSKTHDSEDHETPREGHPRPSPRDWNAAAAGPREEIVPAAAGKKKKRKARKRPSKGEIRDSQTKIAMREIVGLGRKVRYVPSRLIRAHLKNLGVSKASTQYALKRLTNKYADGRLHREELKSDYNRHFKPSAYSLTKPIDSDRKSLNQRHQLLHATFDDHSTFIGSVCEHYYAMILTKTKLFKKIPKDMIGHFYVSDPYTEKPLKIDIIAKTKDGQKFAIEVRNHNSPASQDEHRVQRLFKIRRALPDHEVVFVSSYIDPACREFLNKNGFLWIELGVQLVPKRGLYTKKGATMPDRRHTKTLLKEQRSLFGPQEFMRIECKVVYGKKGLIKNLVIQFPRKKEYGERTAMNIAQTIKAVERVHKDPR